MWETLMSLHENIRIILITITIALLMAGAALGGMVAFWPTLIVIGLISVGFIIFCLGSYVELKEIEEAKKGGNQ